MALSFSSLVHSFRSLVQNENERPKGLERLLFIDSLAKSFGSLVLVLECVSHKLVTYIAGPFQLHGINTL